MRRVFVLFLAVFGAVWTCQNLFADTPNFKPEKTSPLLPRVVAFKEVPQKLTIGEKLVYEVTWLGFTAGQIEMEIKNLQKHNNRDAFIIEGRAYPNNHGRLLTDASCTAKTVIDALGGYSHHFETILKSKNRMAETLLDFDYVSNNAVSKKRQGDKPLKVRVVPIASVMQDSLSAVYAIRSMPLGADSILEMPVFSGKRSYVTQMLTAKTSLLNTPAGKLNVLKLTPGKNFNGVLVNKGQQVTLWVEEKSLIIAKMSIKIKIGSIVARLVKHNSALLPPFPEMAPTPPPPAVKFNFHAAKMEKKP